MTKTNAVNDLKLEIAQIILESVRFDHRADFFELKPDYKPPPTPARVTVQTMMGQDGQAAAVRLRVESNAADALYLYSVSYVVLFKFEGPRPADLPTRLLVTGATMALPYARELISNLSSRGRFGTTWLAPVNFSQLAKRVVPQRKKRATRQSK